MCKCFLKYFTVFAVGAMAYGLIEIAARGFTHITMGFLGGISMIVISILNDMRRKGLPLITELIIITIFITVCEFIAGIILNVNLHLNIWDYSQIPMNIMGQICVPFMFIWLILSYVGIIVEEFMRAHLFFSGKALYVMHK